jgi:ornithine cyclodeaminase/alanine dehydrogenase
VTDLLYLSRGEVARLLPGIAEQVELAERTFRALAHGRVELPPKPGIHPRPDSFIHAMPAYLADEDVAALKWVAGYPENTARGLPYISGLIVVNDADTGMPVAVMDAAEITAARTAAASGLCVRRFAPAGWRRAAILGCGEQGRYHARVLRALNPSVSLSAYDPAPGRARELGEAAADPRSAVRGAEVLVTAAPILDDPRPPIAPDWLDGRWLALPIDFDSSIQAALVRSADLFVVDDIGQFEYYRGQGHFRDWPRPAASLGQALDLDRRFERVACVNLGVGALDAAFAQRVLEAARRAKVGVRLPL